MTGKMKLTNQEVFDAISEAGKLYSNYLEICQTNQLTDCCIDEEDYNRNINYPLTIVLRR